MALFRFCNSYNAVTALSRASYAATTSVKGVEDKFCVKSHHRSSFNDACRNSSRHFSILSSNTSFQNVTGIYEKNDVRHLSQQLQSLHLPQKLPQTNYTPHAQFWTNVMDRKENTEAKEEKEPEGMTKRQALKAAMLRYGPVVIIFHISHSLVGLGIFYILVKSGVDMWPFAQKLISDNPERIQQIFFTSSTFVIAYTLHKLTAPIRIGITLLGFPYVLKVLRRFGYQRAQPPRVTK